MEVARSSAGCDEARFQLEDYVKAHLDRRASPRNLKKIPIFISTNCKKVLEIEIMKLHREAGKDTMLCALCEIRIPILDSEERLETKQSRLVSEVDRIEHISDIYLAADRGVKREADQLNIQGKEATNDFDVFLCNNNADKPAVKQIGE